MKKIAVKLLLLTASIGILSSCGGSSSKSSGGGGGGTCKIGDKKCAFEGNIVTDKYPLR